MDSIDKRIIEELQKNASVPISELSKKIVFINRDHGYSTSLIRKKIKDLDI